MLRETLLIAASASLFTLGCGGSDTTSPEQGSAGTGGSSASVSGSGGDGGSGGDDGSGGDGGSGGDAPIAMGCDATAPATTLISCVESYTPGPGAGHGQERFPEIIYGPPLGAGDHGGSTDVLSLGTGGVIVIGFGGNAVVDGEGADFIVFENAFLAGTKPFKELARISASEDGTTWTEFPCKQDALPYDGCAGWHPVYSNPSNTISSTDPAAAGGDVFDLATIGVKKARFIKIVDLGNIVGTAGTTGFDLDAVAVLHASAP